MLRVPTYLAPSAIEGIGLFAAEAIPRGTLIWKQDDRFDLSYDLRDLDPEDHLLRDMLRCYGYQPGDEPVFVLCGDNARFMNHSSQANADDIGDLTIACADIAKGEEITCDYAKFDRGFARRDFARQLGMPASVSDRAA
ncbi:SET domain-containing protein [Bauldia litoralis]|uniref:SET domain-containing protein n=1 Tax=Bauldia litoralis TaxID=665467 RepID=A0A1G6E653_9HYPH|nr:SET domain-containing protein [Bauldia litoralis]SDB52435.1 hypothetical protein SAMN02982931_04116 [Bauldia litoralis]